MTEKRGVVRRFTDRYFVVISSLLLVALLTVFAFAEKTIITIPAGHGGALWLRFFGGTVLDFTFGEGTKVIFPWDKIYIYDLRVQQRTERLDILTREGLQISAEVTLRFRVRPDSIGAITAYAGPEFIQNLVMPTVAATTRLESAKETVEAIFSTKRHEIEDLIQSRISTVVDDLIPAGLHAGAEIDILDFWFRSITLPDRVREAIEGKLAQSQFAEQYKFILAREQQEKERKTIEAQGIKAFQDTVSSGISENYLRWKGIDATLKLADSPNAKIVIIGGKEGLPVILGGLDHPTPAPVATLPGAEGRALVPVPGGPTASTPSSQATGAAAALPTFSNQGTANTAPAMPTEMSPKLSMPPAAAQVPSKPSPQEVPTAPR